MSDAQWEETEAKRFESWTATQVRFILRLSIIQCVPSYHKHVVQTGFQKSGHCVKQKTQCNLYSTEYSTGHLIIMTVPCKYALLLNLTSAACFKKLGQRQQKWDSKDGARFITLYKTAWANSPAVREHASQCTTARNSGISSSIIHNII